jgi:hypothetical protein
LFFFFETEVRAMKKKKTFHLPRGNNPGTIKGLTADIELVLNYVLQWSPFWISDQHKPQTFCTGSTINSPFNSGHFVVFFLPFPMYAP